MRSASRTRGSALGLALALVLAPDANAALIVHEPFDYPVGTVLDGTPVSGLGLAGTYTALGTIFAQQVSVTAPGLDYGSLVGTHTPSGLRLSDPAGITSAGASVDLAAAVPVGPGEDLYFSALLTLDDSQNGNHLANITLRDDATGDYLFFGEPGVGIGGLRVAASTGALGGLQADGDDGVFTDGDTLFLVGRYLESSDAGGDLLQLLAYETAMAIELPNAFDPADPNALASYTLAGQDIDFGQVTGIDFTIRGVEDNFIDELRIGDDYASVVPEPATGMLLAFALLGAIVRRTR